MLTPNDSNDLFQIVLRLTAALLMGGMIGLDRDLHHKPAGIRVLSMVCVGSTAVTMASFLSSVEVTASVQDGIFRTVQGILSGIGFLGAGVILRAYRSEEVHGLTTASSVWMVAVLGIICGLGLWGVALSTFFLTLVILIGGRHVEKWLQKRYDRRTEQKPSLPDC